MRKKKFHRLREGVRERKRDWLREMRNILRKSECILEKRRKSQKLMSNRAARCNKNKLYISRESLMENVIPPFEHPTRSAPKISKSRLYAAAVSHTCVYFEYRLWRITRTHTHIHRYETVQCATFIWL